MKRILSRFILEYLKFFAKLKLSQIKPVIIGVTGSAGKSSAVAAIEAVLKEKYKVKTTGTTNSESGIPLAILGLKMTDYSPLDWLRVLVMAPIHTFQISNFKFQILVCEMGIDDLKAPKNMEYLLTIVKPKIGVFLNALPVHTQQMGSVENIFKEKSKLISSLPADGTAVVNSDLPEIPTKAKVVKFKDDGTSTPAAVAVGEIFGVNKKTSLQYLATSYQLPPGRWQLFDGINDSTIIDSSYNSSPVPTTNALKRLAGCKGRKIAVLGDMRELGSLAEKSHKEVFRTARECANVIVTVGPLWKQYAKTPYQFDNFSQAGKFLQEFIKPKDVVLFKGSQNTIFLEGAVEMCLANKTDSSKLCRRGKFWNKQRAVYAQA